MRRHARSLGDTLIGQHVVEADPILLAKYKPLLQLYMHSNVIDTVLLYRQVCIDAVKEYSREVLQKSYWQLMIDLKKQFQILGYLIILSTMPNNLLYCLSIKIF